MITIPRIRSFITKTITDPITLLDVAKSGGISKYAINFGYKVDTQDKTKFSFANSTMNSALPKDEISLKQYFKDVSHQYSLGSCVANATADALESTIARKKGIAPELVDDLSRLFVYWNARNNEDPPAGNLDKGTHIWLAFDAITRYGVCAEKYWDYIAGNVNTRPSDVAYVQAIRNRFRNYYSINSTGDARINDIIKALSSGYPVVYGTKIDKSFLTTSDNIVQPPSGDFIGGHAMCITGWSSAINAFENRNSWGTDWGMKGYCWMSPEYLTSNITTDLWTFVI